MKNLIPQSADQLLEWKDELDAANYHYELEVVDGKNALKVTEEAHAFITEIVEAKKQAEKKKAGKAGNIISGVFSFFCLLFIMNMCGAFGEDEPPIPSDPFEAMVQRRERDFGAKSDYRFNLAVDVHRRYLTNPSTAISTHYNLLIVEPDSMTIVMGFSGKNDFGVRKDHSITMVADSTGKIARVVSVQ